MRLHLQFVLSILIVLGALGLTAAKPKAHAPTAPTPITVIAQPAPPSPADKRRDDDRFAIEQRTVQAAELAGWAAIFGSVISAAGIGGLFYSLWLNRQAVLAARASAEAAKISANTAALDLRSWIKMDIDCEKIRLGRDSEGKAYLVPARR